MVFVTLGIATATTASSIQYAAAASSANLWAVPVNSRIDDGNYQILRLHFNLDTGNALEKIRITLDPGTPDEKVLEFNGNAAILTADPAFVFVDGSIKFKTEGDGYYFLSKLSGKFKIAIDKTQLTVGEHDALAEIIRTGETVTDDAHFKLRAGEPAGQPDLTTDSFFAWHNIKLDKKHNAFVTVENIGTGNAGDNKVKVYLSDDNTFDAGDTEVGEKEMKKLQAGKDRMVIVKYELPDDTDLGPAFLIAVVDADEEVSESDEGNNISVREINVVAGNGPETTQNSHEDGPKSKKQKDD